RGRRVGGCTARGRGQPAEQALERLCLGRALPAGTDLVALEDGTRPVERAVSQPPGDCSYIVPARGAGTRVACTRPAPNPIGLDGPAVGTAPRLHGTTV